MAEHLVPLGVLVVVAGLLCVAARRAPGRWLDWVAAAIAVAIVLAELSWQPYVLANHSWSAASSLPVQLCDVGGFVAAAIAIVDLVTGGNYMYLRRVPAGGSLLSLMGPWPWYIAAGVLVALVVLALLDAPFHLWSRRRTDR